LDWARLLSTVPRQRRAIIDCDGNYNDWITVEGDSNAWSSPRGGEWTEICDSISDTILQPTYRPLRANVRSFAFHGYDPSWELPLSLESKEFGMIYVGHNWFRWRGLRRLLQIIEPIEGHIGRMAIVGSGWGTESVANNPNLPLASERDPAYLERLGVQVIPPVPFDGVIRTMSRGWFNPIIYRPIFDYLQLVTCRTFETIAANTIPLFCQSRDFVSDVYGPAALELVLPEQRPQDKIMDFLERPYHYMQVVRELRHVLAQRYSYAARLRELLDVLS
jgi:hypothetical protein